jgi:hypothetical protein
MGDPRQAGLRMVGDEEIKEESGHVNYRFRGEWGPARHQEVHKIQSLRPSLVVSH